MNMRLLALLLTGLLLALTGPVLADDDDVEMIHTVDLGYRGYLETGNTGRAAEYKDLQFGPTLGVDFKGHTDTTHVLIDGRYQTRNDYQVDAHLDVPGTLMLNLASERLWHNLDHIPYDQTLPEARQDGIIGLDPDNDPLTAPVAGSLRTTFEDHNPGDEYGIRVERDTAEATINLGSYPGHLNLKYWRWEKKGKKQMRFVDEGHDNLAAAGPCNNCHIQSKTRPIDRVTQEFTASADAHIGYFDFSVEQLLRTFKTKDPVPVDTFVGHFYGPAGGADFQHSEDPESRLFQTTLKARTALTGGLVADGAYSYGRRENRSELSGRPLGADGIYAVSEYNKFAGNFSWTPTETVTANFRYRLLDLDTSNSDTISADYNVVDKTYPVRDNIDLRRIEYSGSLAWRPDYTLTVKGEYDHEVITRGNVGGPMPHHANQAAIADGGVTDLVWELPREEVIDTLRLVVTARPLRSSDLKLKGWYRFATSSDPAYGASFGDRHELFASAHYAPRKANWGASLSARGQLDRSEDHAHSVWDSPGDVIAYHSSDRERELQSYNLGAWVNPRPNLSAGLNYGYNRTKIVQDILFGASDLQSGAAGFDNFESESEYLQDSHTCSVYTNVQLSERVSLRLDGYLTLAKAEFSPDSFYYVYDDAAAPSLPGSPYLAPSATVGMIASTDGLTAISRLDYVQQGLSAGIDWSPAEQWSIGLQYSLDDYRAKNSDYFDGTAQAGTISVSRTW